TRSRRAGRSWGRRGGTTSGGEGIAAPVDAVEHGLQLVEHGQERGARGGLRGVAVAPAAGLEQAVRVVAELRGRLDVAAEEEDIALRAQALVGERALEPRPPGAAVAGVTEGPEAAEVSREVGAG